MNADNLAELRKLEKEMNVEPDWNIDAFMKAESIEGKYKSVMTEYVVHMLGLGICADTEVGNAMRRGVSGGQKKRVTSGESSMMRHHSEGDSGADQELRSGCWGR